MCDMSPALYIIPNIVLANEPLFSLLLQVALFAVLVLYVWFLSTSKMGLKKLRYSALGIWGLGTILYLFGFMHEEIEEGFISMLLRAMLSSVELFVSHTDLLEIEEVQHEPYFLEFFIFTYACAVVTSISALISLFGQRVLTKFQLKFHRNEKIAHVFFGMDDKTFALAKSISDAGKLGDRKIAFVIFPENREAEKITMGHLLQGVLHGASQKYQISSESMVALKASCMLSDVRANEDVLSQLGLALMKQKIDKDTIFYLLSDDKPQNVRHTLKMITDPFFKAQPIVCRACKDGLTDYYNLILRDTNVHFVYPSTMVSQDLSSNINYHPATVVDVIKDEQGRGTGCIEGGFNAWVIGFGETGQITAHILYEYSNFLHEDGRRAPSHITLIDDNMEMIEGSYRAGVPGVEHERISYEHMRIGSNGFWNKLCEEIDNINYIAITLGDDERNMEVACSIYRYVNNVRKNGWHNMKIVVRCARCIERHRTLLQSLDQTTGGGHIFAYGEYRKLFTAANMLSTNMAGICDDFTRRGAEMTDRLFQIMGVDDSFERHNSHFVKMKEEHQFVPLLQELRLFGQNISAYNFSASMHILFEGNDLQTMLPALIERAAKYEQMRRLASLQMFGYTKGESDDEQKMKLSNMREWDQLPQHSKDYYQVRARVMLEIGKR